MEFELRELLAGCHRLKRIVDMCFMELKIDAYPDELLDLDEDLDRIITELEGRVEK